MYTGVIQKIDAHAAANYDKGWDGWLETMDEDAKIKVFKGGHLDDVPLGPLGYEMCFHRAVIWVADYAETNAAQAEMCALYESNPDFYKKISANSKACREAAKVSRQALKEVEEEYSAQLDAAEEAGEDPERHLNSIWVPLS